MKKHRHEVIVGNIGTVTHTGTYREAEAAFLEYRRLSFGNYGRAAGETVTWMRGDEVYREYIGKLDKKGER